MVMVIAAASVVVAGAVAKDERALQVGIDDGIDVVGRSAAMDADGHLLKELDGAGSQSATDHVRDAQALQELRHGSVGVLRRCQHLLVEDFSSSTSKTVTWGALPKWGKSFPSAVGIPIFCFIIFVILDDDTLAERRC